MIVFLDRDGIILKPLVKAGKGFAITEYSQIEYYEDVKDSLKKLSNFAEQIFVVTNQPDLYSGKLSLESLVRIHKQIYKELPISEIFYCPHVAEQNCDCRKPKTGLFQAARKKWNTICTDYWMIGDRDSDIQAGQNFGCKTIFIERGWKGEAGLEADYKVLSLGGAVEIITRDTKV